MHTTVCLDYNDHFSFIQTHAATVFCWTCNQMFMFRSRISVEFWHWMYGELDWGEYKWNEGRCSALERDESKEIVSAC